MTQSRIDTDNLTQLITSQSQIRIVIDDAGNFGNQAASYNLILRIRELGFTGSFEVIYFKDAKEKIFKLFSLPEVKEKTFHSSEYDINFVELSEFLNQCREENTHRIALGLTGAVDKDPIEWKENISNNNFAEVLNVDLFLRFSPYYYSEGDVCDTKIYLQNIENPVTRNDSCEQLLISPVATLENAKHYLHHTQEGKTLIDSLPALNTLVSLIDNQSINFQPAYGWTLRESPSNLLNMILGARYAQLNGGNDLKKPLIIGGFFDMDDNNIFLEENGSKISNHNLLNYLIFQDNWSDYDKFIGADKVKNSIQSLSLRKSFKMIKLSDANAADIINTLQAEEILLVLLPSLPKNVFDGLFTHHNKNILPPVREGASSLASLLSTTGRPHIHCRSSLNWEIDMKSADEILQSRLTDFNDLICKEFFGRSLDFTAWKNNSPDEMIGNFIIESFDPNSALSTLFLDLKTDALKPENDRIRNDLVSSFDLLTRMSKFCDYIIDSAVTYAASVVNECPSYFSNLSPFTRSLNKHKMCNTTGLTFFNSYSSITPAYDKILTSYSSIR